MVNRLYAAGEWDGDSGVLTGFCGAVEAFSSGGDAAMRMRDEKTSFLVCVCRPAGRSVVSIASKCGRSIFWCWKATARKASCSSVFYFVSKTAVVSSTGGVVYAQLCKAAWLYIRVV